MPAPRIPEGFELMVGKVEDPIADELCYCGALKSEHVGYDGHGSCSKTQCVQFTWFGFLKKKEE